MTPHFQRPAKHTSLSTAVLGSHRVYGRTPLDALSTFCDRHRWHAQAVPPPNVSALTSTIHPMDRPQDRYPVQVTRLAVEAQEMVMQGGRRYLAYPGDYRVTVVPEGCTT